MKPTLSRNAALAGGYPRYFTGEPCKNGHVADRYTLSGACLECLDMHRERETKAFQKAQKKRTAAEG